VSWTRSLRESLRAQPWLYTIWRRLRDAPASARARQRPLSRRRLDAHARRALTADASHAREGEHLRGVLARLGISGGWVVDIAAGDGVTQSCTLPLFRDARWRGLAIEMDPARYTLLERAYRQFPGTVTLRAKVTPLTVSPLLQKHAVPSDFEVLNLDIDSYDLFVAEALLRTHRPLVVSMEVNEKIPPPISFTVLFEEAHAWEEDHFYGCSLVAAAAMVRPFGYVLESLQYNNAFFVRADVAAGVFDDADVRRAYDAGYRDRADRRRHFPWNHDVESLLSMAPDEAVRALDDRFRRYAGRYRLELS
jgi:hypothetical protein